MRSHAAGPKPRRALRAVLVGIGPEDPSQPKKIINGPHCLMVGGNESVHGEMLETALRLESELERRNRNLGEVSPSELAEIAWTIDSPELHRVAVQLHEELQRLGQSFHESSAEDLNRLSGALDECSDGVNS